MHRQGKVQLIDARRYYLKMKKSLGNKRNKIGDPGEPGEPDHIGEITRIHGDFRHDDHRVFSIDGRDKRLTVSMDRAEFQAAISATVRATGLKLSLPERKLILAALGERDEQAAICTDVQGNPEPDPELRDTEIVPLTEAIQTYFEREVLPHVPDAWIDQEKTRIGYEIPLNRHFYRYEPPRPLPEIEGDIKRLEQEILTLLSEVTA